nr:hypothetical protein [Candidatus Enterousia merdequi]
MKIQTKIFTALFLALFSMPLLATDYYSGSIEDTDNEEEIIVTKTSSSQSSSTPTNTPIKQDKQTTPSTTNKKPKSKDDILKREGMVCTNAKEHHLVAKYNDSHECIVQSCVAGYKLEGNSCVEKTSQEKQDAKDDILKRKGMVCTNAKDHQLVAKYNDSHECIVQSCVTGYEVSNDKKSCTEKKEKKDCDAATDAKWIADKCTCTDKTKEWDGTTCKIKSGACKDSYFGIGTYNAKGECEIKECSDTKNYTFNKTTNKCELKTTDKIRKDINDKKEEKDKECESRGGEYKNAGCYCNKTLMLADDACKDGKIHRNEQQFKRDFMDLHDAFRKVLEKINNDCAKEGGKISSDGTKCEKPEQPK